MENSEIKMKAKGEAKVYKDILTKGGASKKASSTQIGQKILFDEAIRILPEVWDWVNNTSARMYRNKLKEYFKTEDFLLEKITQTLLFLSGQVYYGENQSKGLVSKSRHRNIAGLCKKVTPELEFENTFRFLEIVVEASQYYTTTKEKGNKADSYNIKMNYTSTLSNSILEKLASRAQMSFYPMPMTEKPLDWFISEDNEAVGGYSSYQFKLIRQDQRLVDYSQISQQVLDSINYIQSTPWIVNKTLLDIIQNDLVEPKKEDFVNLEYPDNFECRYDIDLKDEEIVKGLDPKFVEELIVIRKQYQDQVALYRAETSDYESELGKYRAIKLALSIGVEYKDEEVIYFPHSFDFRGRVYPLPIGLSPQGSDAVKSLLLYKNVKKLDEDGLKWSWAYLASLYGEDKLDFEDRITKGTSWFTNLYLKIKLPSSIYEKLTSNLIVLTLPISIL